MKAVRSSRPKLLRQLQTFLEADHCLKDPDGLWPKGVAHVVAPEAHVQERVTGDRVKLCEVSAWGE